ncbi:hypothetical protein FRX31_002474 [Thalictrum thalictroides]|uniref:Uncharacterized protein n=1 Tax=Thalictrum thalictroides TaxID=46969 RepID=A0A7J6XFZ8_THATH|nr:hypothetical protein FRX31_002474 [Thalictrum thalictroides]
MVKNMRRVQKKKVAPEKHSIRNPIEDVELRAPPNKRARGESKTRIKGYLENKSSKKKKNLKQKDDIREQNGAGSSIPNQPNQDNISVGGMGERIHTIIDDQNNQGSARRLDFSDL